MIDKNAKVAIVGGGVAGSTTALYLGQLGLNVTLFEKEKELVSGPPFCHLHAGGNLYREISDTQCVTLLKQSIDFLRYYPFVVDYRPTVITVPLEDKGEAIELIPRLKLLQKEYQKLIEIDEGNKVLGESKEYFKLYSKEQIEALKNRAIKEFPKTLDDWMIPVAKNIALDKVQFPLIMVQEYGLNLFRLAAGVKLALGKIDTAQLLTNTQVKDIVPQDEKYEITYSKDTQNYTKNFDYVINAAGFQTGKIDDMLGVPCKSMVEFKAAYVTQWEGEETLFPEIIFHGQRGTPQGMGQFTPYPNGHFQLHGMTKDITLYEDGMVSSTKMSCQPKLKQNFIRKIEESWTKDEIEKRTKNAIKHISKFIPHFKDAKVVSKPLYGAQQIPGDDPTLRVAEVSFSTKRYARCEIVKVSSVLSMIDAIVKELINLKYIDNSCYKSRDYSYLELLNEQEIQKGAKTISIQREYPSSLSNRNVAL